MRAIMLPFVGRPDCLVRILRDDQGRCGFMAIDVTRALGTGRKLVRDLVRRNPELFKKRAFFVDVWGCTVHPQTGQNAAENADVGGCTVHPPTGQNAAENGDVCVNVTLTPIPRIPGEKLPRGSSSRRLLVLTTEGLIAVAMKVSEKQIRNPEARELVVKFQDWAISLIGCVLSGKPPEDPTVVLFTPEMLRGRKCAGLVKDLAAFRGCSIDQARRIVRKYKIAAGLAVRHQPADQHRPRPQRWRDDVTPRWRAIREDNLRQAEN